MYNFSSTPISPSSVSVVIPVYRGAETLRELVERLVRVLSMPSEIILVNDASPDESWSVIQSLVARYGCVRGIDLMKNSGQHNALLCGVRSARNAVTVTMDDDLQHPPELIPDLLAKLQEGYDLVYCIAVDEPRGFVRNFMSKTVKQVVLRYVSRQNTEISSFRAFRTALRRAFEQVNHPGIFLDLMLSWGARRIGELRLPHDVRRIGESSYTLRRLIRHATNMLTSYSVLPLHLASWLGFVITGFGLVVLAVTLINFFIYGRVVPGFTFLSSILAIFSGAQLFSIGILGLYLARMYEGMMAKPPYVVREEIGADDQQT